MDIYSSNWNEDDNSNSTAAPDGAPEGMAPSGINNVLRAHQGAIKRYVEQQIPKTTAGSSTAFTLTYGVPPGALVDGMTHLVQFNATCGASPTLNSLGAIPIHYLSNGTWAVVPAGFIVANTVAKVAYNSAAGTYRIVSISEPIVNRGSGYFYVGPLIVQFGTTTIGGGGGTGAVNYPVAFGGGGAGGDRPS